jgi:thioredoxin 1
MNQGITSVTEDNYDSEVASSTLPVFIDFWAPWCAPCRALEPTVNDLVVKYDGKIKFVKINIDESPALSRRFHVRSIPTLLMTKAGEEIERAPGGTKTRIVAMLDRHI